ncbi:Protein of unknown function [Hymenobacter actinosclerus]|uniref:DUF3667 domain-containing protein n=2 Tax=Hymenobacter actinosclerus TaxID=82805 RepID=A0A1I0FAI0_9BACT|nr:Protein of unknown function [Hymenobacter actinosclerus]
MQPTPTVNSTQELELLPPAHSSAPVPTPAATTHGSAHCLNCGHTVPDRFCGRCGQDAHHTHRLTMADMLHDIPHSIWHIDKGILYTLKTMIFRPGHTIREYLAGKRIDHFRPLSLLLIITSTLALLTSVLHISAAPREPGIPDSVWQMQEIILTVYTKYISWFHLAMVPVMALFARLFLRRGGFNYAECLIIAAFLTAILNFFALLFLPVTYTFSGTLLVLKSNLVLGALSYAYAAWAYGRMLSHTKMNWLGRLWRGFASYALGHVVSFLMLYALVFALNWSTFKKALQLEKQQQAQSQQQDTPPRTQ